MRYLLFENFSNKTVEYDTIKISYEGDPDSLFLIYYTGYDDFSSHDIVDIVESKEKGIEKFEEDAKLNSVLNGANVFKWDEVLKMYKPYDQILKKKDNIDKWLEKENKMLKPYGFKVEKV